MSRVSKARSSFTLNVLFTGRRPIEAKSHTGRDDLASLWPAQGSLRLTDSRFARVIVRCFGKYRRDAVVIF